MRGRARKRDGARAVTGDRRTAAERDVETAVGNRERRRQRTAIDVGNRNAGDCRCCVFGCRPRTWNCVDRCVVDWRDGDCQRPGIGAAVAVGDGVRRDWDGAVVIGCRDKRVRAVGVDRQRADRRDRRRRTGRERACNARNGELRDRQRVAVDIRVISKQTCRRRNRERCVFCCGAGVINRDRRIVDRRDRQRQRTGVRTTIAVRDGVGRDRNGTVVVRGRREDVRAVGVDPQHADA